MLELKLLDHLTVTQSEKGLLICEIFILIEWPLPNGNYNCGKHLTCYVFKAVTQNYKVIKISIETYFHNCSFVLETCQIQECYFIVDENLTII